MIQTVRFGYNELEMFSFDGKIWVRKSMYPVDLDGQFDEDESLYLINDKIVLYVRRINDRVVQFYLPTFWKEMNIVDAVNVLREIAEKIAENLEEGDLLSFYPRSLGNIKMDGIVIDGYDSVGNVLLENEHGAILFDVAASDEYMEYYRKFMEKVKDREYLNAVGKYVVRMNYDKTEIYDVTDDPEFDDMKLMTIAKVNTVEKKMPGFHVILDPDSHTKILSTKNVPENAYIMSINPLTYIQFTGSGILITNGVFFIGDELKEVTLPWYVVRRENNDWLIYLAAETPYDGVYRIHNNTVEKLLWCDRHFIDAYDDGTPIYFDCDNIVYDAGDKYSSMFTDPLPKELVEERIQMRIKNRVVFIPKIHLVNLVPPIS